MPTAPHMLIQCGKFSNHSSAIKSHSHSKSLCRTLWCPTCSPRPFRADALIPSNAGSVGFWQLIANPPRIVYRQCPRLCPLLVSS